MSSSRSSTFRHLFRPCAAGVLAVAAVALMAASAAAETARQRGTFTIDGTTVLGLSGQTTGVVDEEAPITSKVSAELGTQSLGSMQTSYSGTVTADITFDSVTKAITGIHIVNANAAAANNGNWIPGLWDPMKYAPNGKDWDPMDPPPATPDGQLGGFQNNGTDQEAANYGGSILGGIIYFAAREFSVTLRNSGTNFAVAPNGNFTVTTANKGQFLTGHTGIYSPFAPDDIESNDPVTDYRDAEIDTGAVQPATFTYTDGMGMPQMGVNPQAGQAYPSGLVWRYVATNVEQPVFDINHNPVYNTPGVPESGQVTRNFRTYEPGAAGLAPAFETTKGGQHTIGQDPDTLDNDWYDPNDGALDKPDAVRLYVDSTTEFDINGVPLKIRPQLQLPNVGTNFSDGAGTVPVTSNISSTFNGPNNYSLDLGMNVDMTGGFFIGDFAVSLRLGQAKNLFNQLVPNTGRFFADGTFSLRAGDVNNDGFVDIFDVNMVSAGWSPSPQTPSDPYAGDANGDGFVDIFDVNMISANWSPAGGGSAVPEPSTLLLALGGAVALLLGCRRRR